MSGNSTLEQLSPAYRKALATLYETDAYKAIKQLCELEINGLGKDALGSQSHDMTRFYAGQAYMAAKLPRSIKQLHKEAQENEAAKQKR